MPSSAATAIPALVRAASAATIRPRRSLPTSAIVPRRCEGILRALLAAGLVLALTTAALADELVVGVVRDQDGNAVAGARVTGLDAGGAALGSDRSAADGTFALELPRRPARLLVEGDHARTERVAAPPPGKAALVVVRHERAFDAVPAPADLAALPAGLVPDLGSVVPYRVAFPSAISDRYLDRGRGVVTLDGLPFYRRADGADATDLAPAHAGGTLDVRGPLDAPWYGDRAGGGTIDVGTFDGADGVRLTGRDGVVRAGNALAGTLAESWDDGGVRSLAGVRAMLPLGPVATTLTALAGSAQSVSYAGFGASFALPTRLRDLRASVALTRDDGDETVDQARGSVTQVVLDESGRGPNALAVRLRFRAEGGALDTSFLHDDAAVVVGTERGTVVRVRAAVALARESERGSYGRADSTSAAVLPSLAVDVPLNASWSLHAGGTASTLGTPQIAVARAALGEVSLRFDDRNRLRAELVAYDQSTAAPSSLARGIAGSLGWEIAPRLSLRAFALSIGDAVETLLPLYPGGPSAYASVAGVLRRQVAWLTWDAPLRVDALVRDGALEGSVRAPLGSRVALLLGSYRPLGQARQFSVGLAQR